MKVDNCKVCGKDHGLLACEPCIKLSKDIHKENSEREGSLRIKCQWERMGRCAILKEYGDPAGR